MAYKGNNRNERPFRRNGDGEQRNERGEERNSSHKGKKSENYSERKENFRDSKSTNYSEDNKRKDRDDSSKERKFHGNSDRKLNDRRSSFGDKKSNRYSGSRRADRNNNYNERSREGFSDDRKPNRFSDNRNEARNQEGFSDNRNDDRSSRFGDRKPNRFSNNRDEDRNRDDRNDGHRLRNTHSSDRVSEIKKSYLEKKRDDSGRQYAKRPDYDSSRMRELKIKKGDKESKNTYRGIDVRLNKYIANAGVCSRREADKLILSGDIRVNGKVVKEMGHKVQSGDRVMMGENLLSSEKLIYVLLNKPKDYITTTRDPQDRKTVMSLVKKACKERIYPVGRLDRNTTGLLLLTNDGALASKLSHPSNQVKKVYHVELDKAIEQEDYDKILAGLTLKDGPVKVDALEIVSPDSKELGIEIHVGKNRIVRRIFEELGYEVVRLDRVLFAGLTKKDVSRGKWRYLTEKELISLKYFSK